jgi:hypothetical protein
MLHKIVLPLLMAIVGIVLCIPAFRIFAWVITNSSGDINISGIDLALTLSTLGGALVVGAAWVFFWARRQ